MRIRSVIDQQASDQFNGAVQGRPMAGDTQRTTGPSTCLVTSETHLAAAVFRLTGELDVTTSAAVSVSLAAAVGQMAVLFDLSEVSLIDAVGVNVLRAAIHGVYEQGGWVAIARPWRKAQQVMELVGIPGLVFLAGSAAGAMSWLSEPRNRRKTQLVLESLGPGGISITQELRRILTDEGVALGAFAVPESPGVSL
jgi:anti-anti-sigma factor